MTIEQKNKIDLAYKDIFGIFMPISYSWLYDFYEFLVNSEYTEEQVSAIFHIIISKNNLQNMRNSKFGRDNISEKNEKAFFEYLGSIREKLTSELLDGAIEYAMANYQSSNFIDAFIKYIVLSNKEDIKYKSNIRELNANNVATITGLIGNFPLTEISSIKIFDEEYIIFDDFKTGKNLTGAGIGSMLFREFLREVSKYFPNKNVFSLTVMAKNTGGINFYKKMGGEFYKDSLDTPLSPSDIDSESTENLIVVFPKEKIAAILNDESDFKL